MQKLGHVEVPCAVNADQVIHCLCYLRFLYCMIGLQQALGCPRLLWWKHSHMTHIFKYSHLLFSLCIVKYDAKPLFLFAWSFLCAVTILFVGQSNCNLAFFHLPFTILHANVSIDDKKPAVCLMSLNRCRSTISMPYSFFSLLLVTCFKIWQISRFPRMPQDSFKCCNRKEMYVCILHFVFKRVECGWCGWGM